VAHELIWLELTREELEDLAAQVADGNWLTPGHHRQVALLAKLNAALGRAPAAASSDPSEQAKHGY
jgi:hypothetical protein